MYVGRVYVVAPLRAGARLALRSARAAPVWGQVALARQGRGPRLACLASKGREQSSLPRIFNICYALRPLGWRSVVLPAKLTLKQRRAMLAALAPDVV